MLLLDYGRVLFCVNQCFLFVFHKSTCAGRRQGRLRMAADACRGLVAALEEMLGGKGEPNFRQEIVKESLVAAWQEHHDMQKHVPYCNYHTSEKLARHDLGLSKTTIRQHAHDMADDLLKQLMRCCGEFVFLEGRRRPITVLPCTRCFQWTCQAGGRRLTQSRRRR